MLKASQPGTAMSTDGRAKNVHRVFWAEQSAALLPRSLGYSREVAAVRNYALRDTLHDAARRWRADMSYVGIPTDGGATLTAIDGVEDDESPMLLQIAVQEGNWDTADL